MFLHKLILENEAQIDQKNYRTMVFMSKQVSLPKISSILQKVKIDPKTDIPVCPFCMKAFNFSESYTAYHLMTKLAWSRWLVIGLILFLHLQTSTQSLHKHAQKLKLNLANIKPSRPHAWSVTRVSTINSN